MEVLSMGVEGLDNQPALLVSDGMGFVEPMSPELYAREVGVKKETRKARDRALAKLSAALWLYHNLNVPCPHCGRLVLPDSKGGYKAERKVQTRAEE